MPVLADPDGPEHILGTQWGGSRVSRPERMLYVALLEDARRVLRAGPEHPAYRSTLDWLRGGEARLPFAMVCEGLGLSEGWLRRRMEVAMRGPGNLNLLVRTRVAIRHRGHPRRIGGQGHYA
jgi:hypothetical protein